LHAGRLTLDALCMAIAAGRLTLGALRLATAVRDLAHRLLVLTTPAATVRGLPLRRSLPRLAAAAAAMARLGTAAVTATAAAMRLPGLALAAAALAAATFAALFGKCRHRHGQSRGSGNQKHIPHDILLTLFRRSTSGATRRSGAVRSAEQPWILASASQGERQLSAAERQVKRG
jgi:hypothetical protein